LDAATFNFTPLSDDGLGGYTPVPPVLYENFAFDPEPLPSGGLTYSIRDICFPSTCLASVLNDAGDVAGPAIDGAPVPFIISAGGAVTRPAIPPGSLLSHMNNSGVIVGGYPQQTPYMAPPGADGMLLSPI
jgi:hypothetical protein